MKTQRPFMTTVLVGSMLLTPLVGCEQLPGDKQTQGAVIGGVGGAVAGGAIAKNNRLIGALIGGALGAGGGYLIGTQLEKSDHHNDENRTAAREADRRARENPVTSEEARRARTADINNDGYVTLDEVVAMQKAGFNDNEMISRLERTNQFFELTQEQESYLMDRGVSRHVVVAMRNINSDVRDRAYARNDRIDR